MPFPISRNDRLSPEEARIEADFSSAIQTDLESYIQLYNDRFGRVIDTDLARELCPVYAESSITRTRWSRAVYNPAKALVDEAFRRAILRLATIKGSRVLFMSGGTGAGKGTALAQLLDGYTSPENHDLLVDGTLSDLTAARVKLRMALRFGCYVTIIYVHRAFPETVRMVVQRAIQIGRSVALEKIAATHFRSRATLLELIAEFEERINVRLLVNSDSQPVRRIFLEELESLPLKGIDELRAEAHTLFLNEFGSLETSHPEIHRSFLQPS